MLAKSARLTQVVLLVVIESALTMAPSAELPSDHRASFNPILCTKGGDPVLDKSCLPGTCTSSIVSSKAAAVFRAEATEDKCVDPCACPSTGLVVVLSCAGLVV